MEHDAVVSACADLPALPAELVVEFFLFSALVFGWAGNVPAGQSLDGEHVRGGGGRGTVRIQWTVVEHADVAKSHCDTQLDAVGGAGGGSGVATRRQEDRRGGAG